MEGTEKKCVTENQAPVDQTTPKTLDGQSDNCQEKLSRKGAKSRQAATKQSVVDRFFYRETKQNMYVELAVTFLKQFFLLLLGYLVCWYNFSFTLPIVAICSFIFYNHVKPKKGERIRKKVEAATLTKLDLIEIVKDLPSWVSLSRN